MRSGYGRTACVDDPTPPVYAWPYREPPAALPFVSAGTEVSAVSWYLRNTTPRPIWMEQGNRILSLAPLEQQLWAQDPRETFPRLRTLLDRRQVDIRSSPEEHEIDPLLIRIVRLSIVAGLVWLASFWPLPLWWWQRIGGVLAVVCALSLLIVVTLRSRSRTSRQVRRWTWYNAAMCAVLAVGVLLPAGVVYVATDLHEVISVWPDGFRIDTDRPLVVIGRLMQITFIAAASLLPALMYFQFDAERLATLRDRWIQNVFRLDPTVATTHDVNAKYGKYLEEAYGCPEDGHGRLARGRRSPIILTTLILAFGWLLILRLGPIDGSELSFITLLEPDPSLVAYAFLGAYFFGLCLVWRGFVRADLRPKTYSTIAVRVMIVVILAWLIDVSAGVDPPTPPLYLLAFAAGFVPDQVLHLLYERVLPRLGGFLDAGRQQQLTELEGIDLYERTRLSEEGITNVEALAHHDLLDLFLKTRIPATRLIDWVDQAILTMYLGPEADGAPDRAVRAASGPELRWALRTQGVRTATDLVNLVRRADDPRSPQRFDALVEELRTALPAGRSEDIEQRLRQIAETLDRSEWLGRITNWRYSDLIERDPAKRRYIDGNGDLRSGDPRQSVHRAARRPFAAATRQPHARRARHLIAMLLSIATDSR